ncbi:MAG: hypothetical protein IPL41_09190 [Micropruina sp.]|nr:hypothetical protein [Micropruina sp.]
MTALPAWLAGYAALGDDTLAVLANRGLVRRGHKEVSHIELVAAEESSVRVRYTGVPAAEVTLLPGGPRQASCGCPVAGSCLHIVAACLWARSIPSDEPDVLAELLALDPSATNRAAGIAAVRRVARVQPSGDTVVEQRPGSVTISWPGSPTIVAVAGGGFAGMVTSGGHSDVAERAWRLEAVVRLFAAHRLTWVWPAAVDVAHVVHPGQRDAMRQAIESIEALLRVGLARLNADGSARLVAAAQRARLEALPLLAILLTQASGRAAQVAARADDASERDLLDVLARAHALAGALSAAEPPLPAQLVGAGRGASEAVEVGVLTPLALRWWTASSGARGLTATLWDTEHARLETVTTGRAAGTDPSFARSWTAPLLWGTSASTLAGGPFTLLGAERRDDGTLSPTTRTRVHPEPRFAQAPAEVGRLAAAVNGEGGDARTLGFLPPPTRVRVLLPRRLLGVGGSDLDEVAQQLVWPVTDRSGVKHLLRMDATGPDQGVIGWLLVERVPIEAVVVDEQHRPLGLFVTHRGAQRLIAPSLTPADWAAPRGRAERRRSARQPRAHTGSAPAPSGPLAQLCDALLDVCEALASTGRPALSARQRDTVQARVRQADDLGLRSLAGSRALLLADPVPPAAVLRATFVVQRVRQLAGD